MSRLTLQQFKYRAEIQCDIWRFQNRLLDFVLASDGYSCYVIALDADANIVTLETTVPLETLIKVAWEECPDCHCIARTIQPIDKFNNEDRTVSEIEAVLLAAEAAQLDRGWR